MAISTQLDIIADLQDNVSKKLTKMESGFSRFRGTLLKVTAGLAIFDKLIDIGGSIVEVNMEFDRLETQIRTFSDSAQDAAASMEMIKKLTKGTPFQLNEVTQAFVTLKSRGLKPTRDALYAFGEIAVGAGTSITQVSEAVADAITGEFERLKAFGITASKQGDQIEFMFDDVTTTVRNNAKEIQQYLVDLGNTKFAGGIAAQTTKLEGAWSNAKDSWAELARTIGESGLNEMLISVSQAIGAVADFFVHHITRTVNAWRWFKQEHAAVFHAIEVVQATFVREFEHHMNRLEYTASLAWMGIKLLFLETVNFIAEAWNGLVNGIIAANNELADTWLGEKLGMEKMAEATNEFALGVEATYAAIEKEHARFKAETKAINDNYDARVAASLATADGTKEVEDNTDALTDNTTALGNNAGAQMDLNYEQEDALKLINDLTAKFDEETTAIDNAWNALEMLDQMFIDGKISAEQYQFVLDNLQQSLLDTADAGNKTKTVFEKVMDNIKGQRVETTQTKDALRRLKLEYDAGRITLEEYNRESEELKEKLDQTTDAQKEQAKAVKKTKEEYEGLIEKIQEYNGATEAMLLERADDRGGPILVGALPRDVEESLKRLDEMFKNNEITREQYQKGWDELMTAFKRAPTVYSKTLKDIAEQRKRTQETKIAVEQLHDAYKRGIITYREYASAMSDYGSYLADMGDATGELIVANEKLNDSFANVFDEIIEGGKASKESLRKLIRSFVEYIFTANQAAAINPFTSTTQGSATGLFTGIASSIGGAIGKVAGGIGDFIGGLFRAEGGPVMSNMPYIVGERGPELFVPKTNGDIRPNGSFGMGGGPININISALDGADVMRVLTQNRREISELVAGTTRTFGY